MIKVGNSQITLCLLYLSYEEKYEHWGMNQTSFQNFQAKVQIFKKKKNHTIIAESYSLELKTEKFLYSSAVESIEL